MTIRPEEVAEKKRVGNLRGAPVFHVGLKGGLHLMLVARSGKFETLSVGPHKAVSRHIAKKKEPEIEWTDLAKADYIDPAHFAWLLPEFEAMTDAFRAIQGL
jgi:hypothetical protein